MKNYTLTDAARLIGAPSMALLLAANRGLLDTYKPPIGKRRVTLSALREFAVLFGYRVPELVT